MRRTQRSEYLREAERTAQRLGLPAHGPATDTAIVDYCCRQVEHLTRKHGLPSTTGELLEIVAACLDVEFIEIHSEDDLKELVRRFPPVVEPAIVRVQSELSDGTDAITIRRRAPQAWERRYLAVINCQGRHYYRRYFTKWHELVHRLIDGEQLTLAFRQTLVHDKDPGEMLVDKVAGELAFFSAIVGPHARKCLDQRGLTFDSVEALRQSVAPDASLHATALALIRHAKRPAWYLKCAMSLKLSETRQLARTSTGTKAPSLKLRVTSVSPNDAAAQSDVRIHQWMRVPKSGLIARAQSSISDQTGTEQLEEWETNGGGPIGFGQIFVDVRVAGDEVLALVSIIDT